MPKHPYPSILYYQDSTIAVRNQPTANKKPTALRLRFFPNHIFACASAGEGNVPEFVCKSREQTDLLETFFFHELEASTEEKCLICIDKSNPLIQDFMLLSQKGLFCFDSYIDDTKQRYYKKYTAPVKPLFLDDLPHNIQHMLLGNRTDADVEIDTLITVPHAY